jgi:hypothetical protein
LLVGVTALTGVVRAPPAAARPTGGGSVAAARPGTCAIHGPAAVLDLVLVTPAGEPPIRRGVQGAPAALQLGGPGGRRGVHHVDVGGALAFEGLAPAEWAHLVTARPATTASGRVRLARGVPLRDVEGVAAGAATATVEIDRAVRLPRLPLPCAALGLDEPAAAETLDAPLLGPADGTHWVARGQRLAVRSTPGGGDPYTLEVEYAMALPLSRVRARGRFAQLDSWQPGAAVEIAGWVDEDEVDSYLPTGATREPAVPEAPAVEPAPPAPRGVYEGPAMIAPGTAVYATAAGRGPWATVRDDRTLTVRWRPSERFVQVVAARGLRGLFGHAFIDRAAVRLPLPPGTWRVTGAPASSRLGHTATRLVDGQVLIVGGWGPLPADPDRRVPLAASELYDGRPAAERFTLSGALATGRAGHTATLLADGRVLVVGGEWLAPGDAGIALGTAEIYDPGSGAFGPAGVLAEARTAHTATLLTDGTVLIAGGDDGHGRSLESAELWDPRDGRFHAAARLGLRRYDHTATRLLDGRVLIVGGRHKNYALREWWTTFPIDSVELYDPVAGGFVAAVELPLGGRTRHSATLLPGGKVLIAGGARDTDLDLAGIARGALVYQPGDGRFVRAGDSGAREEEARGEHSATALGDGRVLVVSGPHALVYDPVAERWSSVAGPTFERSGHTATLLGDGRVLVVGGEPGEDHLAVDQPGAELFQPTTSRQSLR